MKNYFKLFWMKKMKKMKKIKSPKIILTLTLRMKEINFLLKIIKNNFYINKVILFVEFSKRRNVVWIIKH